VVSSSLAFHGKKRAKKVKSLQAIFHRFCQALGETRVCKDPEDKTSTDFVILSYWEQAGRDDVSDGLEEQAQGMMETGRRVGNPPSEGKHQGGQQHPAANSSDKSRGNWAGIQWKCGFTTQRGTGRQKAFHEPKNKSWGQPRWRSQDAALRSWTFGPRPPNSDRRRAGRTAAPARLPMQACTETATHNFSPSGRNWEKEAKKSLLLEFSGQGGSEL